MEDETAKGLHFPRTHYAPIRRTGTFTARSESFQADNGQKAMRSLDARGVTAKFDPWGVLLRQRRIDGVQVGAGEVEIQIYEAHPEAVAPKPRLAFLLPNRVYLKKIESAQANVTWRFRGERPGFFGTQLLIRPNGPDFEYFATGGRLKMAPVPDLDLRRAHILITKTLLTLYHLDLASDSRSDESIRVQGQAGIGKDKSIDVKANFDRVAIRPWLPAQWERSLSGSASGEVHWRGENPKLESSFGNGTLRVSEVKSRICPFWPSWQKSPAANPLNLCSWMIVQCALHGCIRRSTSKTSQLRIKANFESKGPYRSSAAFSAAQSNLLSLADISTGCRRLKKSSIVSGTAISGPLCISPTRLMNEGSTSARASSNFSNNRRAHICNFCFVNLEIG